MALAVPAPGGRNTGQLLRKSLLWELGRAAQSVSPERRSRKDYKPKDPVRED